LPPSIELSFSLHICTQDQEFSAGDNKIYDKNCENTYERMEVRQDGKYDGHLESKERFAIKKYLLTIGKKKNMQVLSHTFTYFST